MSEHSNENSSAETNVEATIDQADQTESSITTTASIASSSPATSLQSLSLATSVTDDKNEKLKITLDNPLNTYYSGQTIRGTISLNCKQKKKIRGKWNENKIPD